jgi:hypothetical protein
MGLELVIARARTRGKAPQEFTFKGVGRIQSRKVNDKDGNPIILDDKGNQVKYSFDKEGKVTGNENITQNEKGELVLSGNLRFVEVDELESRGLTEDLQDVLNLFGSLSEDDRGKRSPLQMVIDSAIDGYNYNARKLAAPVTEQVTTDELTPITAALVEHKIMSEVDATTWRRTVTQAAKLMDAARIDYAKMTPQYKKLVAAGYKEAA